MLCIGRTQDESSTYPRLCSHLFGSLPRPQLLLVVPGAEVGEDEVLRTNSLGEGPSHPSS